MNKVKELLKQALDLEDMDYRVEAKINDALNELEELIKPKTCEGCIRLYFDEIEKVYKCWNDVSDDVGYLNGEAVIRNIKDFCCNQFQPKDNV